MHSQQKPMGPGIETPHPHDVLCGRGKHTNTHPGNRYFRSQAGSYREDYVRTNNVATYSRIIVDKVNSREPPGRFLRQDSSSKLWYEVDKKRALEKAKQALREGAPKIRRGLHRSHEKISKQLEGKNSTTMGYDGTVESSLHAGCKSPQSVIRSQSTFAAETSISSRDLNPQFPCLPSHLHDGSSHEEIKKIVSSAFQPDSDRPRSEVENKPPTNATLCSSFSTRSIGIDDVAFQSSKDSATVNDASGLSEFCVFSRSSDLKSMLLESCGDMQRNSSCCSALPTFCVLDPYLDNVFDLEEFMAIGK